ncbi:agmatinase [Caloramator fervidus]|uniref:Agmatinase n=1 Tax=Caloramator fervidus TaxID=29344 RepID=A0A1H5SM03_9CLOT|nr:arginase family protein [Caloramator fervidus]SEF51464.1 agmatinase [Caloramator fervidus]
MKNLNGVSIINCDNTLLYENAIISRANKIIDFTNITGLRMFSSMETIKKISKKVSSIINNINFLGSGDFHHLTYSIISNIPYEFSLIVFDNHCDYSEVPYGTISCGSWINQASYLKNISSIIILGVSKISYQSKSNKIYCIEYNKDFINNSINLINKTVKSNVYISIDKDVLDQKYAITNWDQGKMKLDELLFILKYIKSKFKIIGLDISGECKPYNPLSYIISNEVKVNQETNLKILDAVI